MTDKYIFYIRLIRVIERYSVSQEASSISYIVNEKAEDESESALPSSM
jgi:hypothetical protein